MRSVGLVDRPSRWPSTIGGASATDQVGRPGVAVNLSNAARNVLPSNRRRTACLGTRLFSLRIAACRRNTFSTIGRRETLNEIAACHRRSARTSSFEPGHGHRGSCASRAVGIGKPRHLTTQRRRTRASSARRGIGERTAQTMASRSTNVSFERCSQPSLVTPGCQGMRFTKIDRPCESPTCGFQIKSVEQPCMSSALSLEAHRENRRTVKQGQNIGWNLGSEQWKPRFKRCIKIQSGAVLAISIFACFRDSSAVPVFHPISSL